jgi:hypothetical protein
MARAWARLGAPHVNTLRPMSEDPSSTGGVAHRSWFDRLSQALSGEPRNREELLEELRAAHENGLLPADTLAMICAPRTRTACCRPTRSR